jgi:hypothetical protein
VESEARAREEEEGLRGRVARAEGGARKALGRLLAREFSCEADARRALEEAGGRLPYHRLVYLGVQEERRRGRVGRPRKGEAPLSVSYRLLARLEVDPGKLERARRGLGRFLQATNVLDREALPALEVLGRYKDQTRTVERGFRFLKDPLFFSGSTFLKRPERVMALGMVMALAFKAHPALGLPALPLGAPGLAGRLAPGAEPGFPSRNRGAPARGTAILPAGVRGVRNVGSGHATIVGEAAGQGRVTARGGLLRQPLTGCRPGCRPCSGRGPPP